MLFLFCYLTFRLENKGSKVLKQKIFFSCRQAFAITNPDKLKRSVTLQYHMHKVYVKVQKSSVVSMEYMYISKEDKHLKIY